MAPCVGLPAVAGAAGRRSRWVLRRWTCCQYAPRRGRPAVQPPAAGVAGVRGDTDASGVDGRDPLLAMEGGLGGRPGG